LSEVVGQAVKFLDVGDGRGSKYKTRVEVGVLKVRLGAEGEAFCEAGVEAAAGDGGERGGLAGYVVGQPVSVHAPRAEQTFDEAGFPAEAAVVLAAGHDEDGMLGRSLVGSLIARYIELEAEAVPAQGGKSRFPSVERLVGAGNSVNGVGEPAVVAGELVERVLVGLGVKRRCQTQQRNQAEKAREGGGHRNRALHPNGSCRWLGMES
jgi:hypothetical protein